MKEPAHPVLAQGKVRHVGDQVALIVAETLLQAKDAAELVVVDYDELPAVIDISAADSAGDRGARRGRRQHLLRLGPRRQGRGRRRVRQGGARHQALVRQQPADPERDRAARRQRRLQPQRRELHALRRQPEPARRAAADVRLRARPAGIEGARDRARRRRRLRLEDLPLSGRRRAGLGEQARRPADQVDGRAQRIVPHRRARPRPRHDRRAGDGRGTATSWRCASRRSPTWARTCRPSPRRCRRSSTPPCSPASTRRRRSTPRSRRCSPTPRRSTPTAAPADPRRPTSSSASSSRRRAT